jgi:hypothetical protein
MEEDFSQYFTPKMMDNAIFISNFISINNQNISKEEKVDKKQIDTFFDSENNLYIFDCPHCNLVITVDKNQINCKIFRHGYLYEKHNSKIILLDQINPHASKEQCDNLKAKNMIYGCGKPFKVDIINDKFIVEKCDYI